LQGFLASFFTALLSYFVIIDPIGSALIFGALTEARDGAFRRTVALRATLLSISVTLCFGFFGAELLRRLGISLDAFRIAGGLLLFYTAFNMVTKRTGFADNTDSDEPEDISVFPMAFPLLAGPGCLTLTILLFSDARHSAPGLAPVIAAVVLIYLLTLAFLAASKTLSSVIGKTGNNVIKRLLGVLLASLSVQFVVDGIRGVIG
jgi:multiple antibiotic resistance protein